LSVPQSKTNQTLGVYKLVKQEMSTIGSGMENQKGTD